MEFKRKIEKHIAIIILFALAFTFFVAMMWSISVLQGQNKSDITTQKYNSLSENTKNIIKKLNSPINVSLYVSDNIDSEYPELGLHRQYIERLLTQLQSYSDGKINITIKTPDPYSATEYEAQSIGIRDFPNMDNSQKMYFGAVFSNSRGEKEIIPYFSIQRQNYAEYDILRILRKLQGINKTKIGVVSFAGNISDWQIFKKLKQDYQLQFIDYKISILPQDLDILIIYNPQQMSTSFLYSLDQYIMHGGNLLMFIDPYAEKIAEKYPYIKKNKILISNFLENLGLEFNPQRVIGDKSQIGTEYQNMTLEEQNPIQFSIGKKEMKIPDSMGGNVLRLTFSSPGELQINPKSTAEYSALFTTGEQGGTIDAEIAKFSEENIIKDTFQTDNKPHVIGYLIEGWFESLYNRNIYTGSKMEKLFRPFLLNSIKKSTILIIADSDFMADETWNMTTYQKDASVYDQIPSANNADFILSVIDYMSNNNELAKIKIKYLIDEEKNISEQIYSRIYKQYAPKYAQKRQEIIDLQKDLNAFQRELNDKSITMSLSKIQEVDSFNRRQQELKEDIKKMNYEMQKDCGNFLNMIIVYNLILYPFLILVIAYLGIKIFIYRHKQQNLRIFNEHSHDIK